MNKKRTVEKEEIFLEKGNEKNSDNYGNNNDFAKFNDGKMELISPSIFGIGYDVERKKRGRPKKIKENEDEEFKEKKSRGRPRKQLTEEEIQKKENQTAKKRGRPFKDKSNDPPKVKKLKTENADPNRIERRGRPKKNKDGQEPEMARPPPRPLDSSMKKGRGRPRKIETKLPQNFPKLDIDRMKGNHKRVLEFNGLELEEGPRKIIVPIATKSMERNRSTDDNINPYSIDTNKLKNSNDESRKSSNIPESYIDINKHSFNIDEEELKIKGMVISVEGWENIDLNNNSLMKKIAEAAKE